MALEQVDGEEAAFDRIREALQSLPFLASKKLVVLRNPGANKQFLEAAEDLIKELPETTDLIIVEPKLDKRTVYYKLLKGEKGFIEFKQLDGSGLSRWLVQTAKERGGELKQTDAAYLVERVGANQQLLDNELQKLLLYKPVITREAIDALTDKTPQSTIFELLDAALAGDSRRALQLYQEQRAMRVDPQQIMALLGWQLHVLALVKTAGERDTGQIAREARLSPYTVGKAQKITRHMTLPQLKKLINDTLKLDIRLKSENIDADEALQNLILTMH